MDEIQLNDGTSVKIEQIERAVYYGIGASKGYGEFKNGKVDTFKHETPYLVIHVKGNKSKGAVGNADELRLLLEQHDVRVDIAP